MTNCNDKIKALRKSTGLSLRDFAARIGVTHTTVARIEKGGDKKGSVKESVQIDTLKKICEAANYDFQTFLEETGYLSPVSHMLEKTEIQMLYDSMNQQQQILLIGYARGLLSNSTKEFNFLATKYKNKGEA